MNAISETEHARLAQWFLCEPLKRMGVLGFPASGQRTWPPCHPARQGTDSRLCGDLSLACGGNHADESIQTGFMVQGNDWVCFPALPRAKGLLKNKSRVKKQSSNIMTLGFLVLCLLKMSGFGCKQRHRVVFQFPNPMD